jgi:hypothetical protein
MENVGIFYDNLEYFTAIWYNLWPFCMVCGHLVYFFKFGIFGARKIWQPLCKHDISMQTRSQGKVQYSSHFSVIMDSGQTDHYLKRNLML